LKSQIRWKHYNFPNFKQGTSTPLHTVQGEKERGKAGWRLGGKEEEERGIFRMEKDGPKIWKASRYKTVV